MRNKIDYGIDLGTTNSAIARMENGKPKVIQTDFNKDTLPSCVAVNPRKNLIHGDAAYAANIKDKIRLLKSFGKDDSNSYLEFKRTMGKDVKYHSTILNKDFTSEELSSEVLKKLKSFVTDEQINSIVITVPAKFTMAQNEATLNSAKLAGFQVVELLQEPIAASIAYGLDAKNKKGIWLVFDFGGGTFDAALVRVEEGIMKVLDTAGDSELGGKDLDLAIVDKIIIPYLKENFSIEGILSDKDKNQILRNAMKSFAEKAKIDLSFNQSTDITTLPGEINAEDESGIEYELSLDITQEDLTPIFEPFFQKAIDITKNLLQKKGLKGSGIECLILVGGPTYSPILQKMLREQITPDVIAKNQMTSVAIGAALYASTKDIGTPPPPPPKGTISLVLKYEATTVETDEMISLKIDSNETNFSLPEKVFAVLERGDKSYSSNKVQISDKKSTLIEVILNENEANYFSIVLTDEKGDKLPCQPNNFTMLQGLKEPAAPLPYHIGIEVWDDKRKIKVFKGLKGLEKNQILKKAVGVITGIKTPKQLTAGKINDVLRIPIYQGEDGAENKNSFLSNHVTDVVITGETLLKIVPVNSDIEVTLTFNESGGNPICSVFFPSISHTEEVKLEISLEKKVDSVWVRNEIKADLKRVDTLLKDEPNDELVKSGKDLEGLSTDLKNEEGSEEGKMRILNNLRKVRLILDKYELDNEWPTAEAKLKDAYYKAEELIEKIEDADLWADLNKEKILAQLKEYKITTEKIILDKELQLAKETTDDIISFISVILDSFRPEGEREKGYIDYVDRNFSKLPWTNPTTARYLINQAINNLNAKGSLEQLEQFCIQIDNLRDRSDPNQPTDIPKL